MKTMPTSRRKTFKNPTEAAFAKLARSRGWHVCKRGWPDFIATDNQGRIIAVECKPARLKPRKGRPRLTPLTNHQVFVFDWLSSLGAKCYVSDGETLEPYDIQRHAPRHAPVSSSPRGGTIGGCPV